ncbi:MAG: hypothetical protein A3A94_02675 [Candidatus Portnoybacteria bacterium RIFCSPLOWO2_01_FULL_43_11]|uniref:DUF5673 domain-containing protein n=4 Tax=Candidatus Portnoyibacteriota TaxID=1817913 RepID=A0A1G2FBP0_9BACT|nr:MAG: hypothetical protein A2815_00625 [Candidatus Portnoybacteria bacterium RIFCSPHIGHO2_01_FULL_40_12b]OGZ38702.1 MAG: hypothetical protein A3A94_02675 [Candidatus Portnoybacteria bacterium RIFCSPLOWO2_01_FULL_43_11]OGZ38748.1 MAG: hypothetical protein A3E90_03360 [Candidatus Portnoybacteria bacterium RIFCSPHIGHO2_12_FULL_40_11]OGZ41071.1 MAG: hypothetical protein A3I20_01355 [Candidatus Portnoybacteria bacterium RIFCSPLOWO2_02_FULL_40_15]
MEQIINLKEKNKITEAPKAEITKRSKPAKKTKDVLEWMAPEFQYYPKNQSWFTVGALITLGLIIWAAFSKNFLLILMIILGYFSIVVFALKKPRKIRLAVTPKGIMIDESLYAYDNLKSFWIFYDPPEISELSLRSKKTVMPFIKIPLGNENPIEVRKILLKYLPERKQEESVIDNLARGLRF